MQPRAAVHNVLMKASVIPAGRPSRPASWLSQALRAAGSCAPARQGKKRCRGGPDRAGRRRERAIALPLCAVGERLAAQGWAARGWDGRRGLADLRTGRAGLETAHTAARPHDDVVRPPGPALPLSCRRSPKSVDPESHRCSCFSFRATDFGSLPAQLRGALRRRCLAAVPLTWRRRARAAPSAWRHRAPAQGS